MEKVIDYKLVRGQPDKVEAEVQALIKTGEGWQPKGDILHYIPADSNKPIFIQQMNLYEDA